VAKNQKRRSTSFTRDEVDLACELFEQLRQGDNVAGFVHRKGYRDLASRFLRMREALRNNVAIRDVTTTGVPGARPSKEPAQPRSSHLAS